MSEEMERLLMGENEALRAELIQLQIENNRLLTGFLKDKVIQEAHKLESKLSEREKEVATLQERLEQYQSIAANNVRLREALEKILKVSQFGRDGGPIVTSEHYEGAWLDCVDIAEEALNDRHI